MSSVQASPSCTYTNECFLFQGLCDGVGLYLGVMLFEKCAFKYRVTVRAMRGSYYESYGAAVAHRGDRNLHLELTEF